MKRLMGAVISILIAGLLALPPAAAQSRGSETGTVDHVDLKNGLVVIGDIQFRVTSATLVYTPTGSLGTLQHLQKGMKVQLNAVKPEGPGKPVITEIRMVPAK